MKPCRGLKRFEGEDLDWKVVLMVDRQPWLVAVLGDDSLVNGKHRPVTVAVLLRRQRMEKTKQPVVAGKEMIGNPKQCCFVTTLFQSLCLIGQLSRHEFRF